MIFVPRITTASILVLTCMTMMACNGLSFGKDKVEAALEADFSSAYKGEDNNQLARPPNVLADVDEALLSIGTEGTDRLLPTISNARLKREGSLYWLEVDIPPQQAWDTAREFWLDQGFALEIEIPEVGIMETDWRQDRSKVLGTGIAGFLDIALERLNDTGERYRFRCRVENGDTAGTSLIFISYRAFRETVSLGKLEYDPLPRDLTLEAEMLRRLLLTFSLPRESLASLSEFQDTEVIDELYEQGDGTLTILRNQEEAWRRLLQALDRSGYTIVTRDQAAGEILIRVANPTVDSDTIGFFDRFFGNASGQPEGEPFETTIAIKEVGANRTQVVLPEGELGERITNVLIKNL